MIQEISASYHNVKKANTLFNLKYLTIKTTGHSVRTQIEITNIDEWVTKLSVN